MTSAATTTSSAASLVGRSGMGEWGKRNPKWYPCVVKADNGDGTIKVQWDEDKKFTFRLPIEKFRVAGETVEEPSTEVPIPIFPPNDDDGGDY